MAVNGISERRRYDCDDSTTIDVPDDVVDLLLVSEEDKLFG